MQEKEELLQEKEVLLLLTDHWADWEASYAITGINSAPQYAVKTIAIDKKSKVSIGGLHAHIDYAIEEYQCFDHLAMVILTGSYSWGKDRHDEIADFVKKVNHLAIPIAAICGATIFLGKHGFLDHVKHTGDELEYFQEQLKDEEGYNGQEQFILAQSMNDKGFITANATAALEFAREILRTLKVYTNEEIDSWYEQFKHGMID